MSMPPPPPPSSGPEFGPPPGFQPYGAMPPAAPRNSSMAVAALVLSLVGLIPCFWFFQLPGLLGAIFGFVGLGQTKPGGQGGRGMAIAGVVIGLVLTVACAAFWIWLASSGNCRRNGSTWECYTD